MSVKKISIILFIVLYHANFSISQNSENYGLLWKIEKEGMNPSYIYGTIHLKDKKAFNFPDSVYICLEQCDQFALEINPDSVTNYTIDQIFKNDTVDLFKELLDSVEYENFKIRFEAQNGISFDELPNKDPIEVNEFKKNKEKWNNEDRNTIVDLYLYGIAVSKDKRIQGIENISEHFDLVYQTLVLEEKNFNKIPVSEIKQQYKNLINAYAEGDLFKIEEILSSKLDSPIFLKRNKLMANNLMKMMESSSVFAAVGAGHLVGDSSIVNLLIQKGYTLSKVKATYSGIKEKNKLEINNQKWEKIALAEAAVEFEFPVNYSKSIKRMPFDKDSVEMNIYSYIDLIGNNSYFFIYNDLPVSYFYDGIDTYLELQVSDLATEMTIFDKQKFKKNNISGIEIQGMLSNNYFFKYQVFIRGNRTYKFITQNLNQNEKKLNNNKLFDSINFLPFLESQIGLNDSVDTFFIIPQFCPTIGENIQTTFGSYNENKKVYSTKDQKSGNVFITYISDFSPYFKLEHIDSFYRNYSNEQNNWQDTVISSLPFIRDDISGIDLTLKRKNENFLSRQRVWVDQSQFVIVFAHADSVSLFSNTTNDFFNSVKRQRDNKKTDLFCSKSKIIMDDLKSKDTTIVNKALGAFQYYKFDSTDIKLLCDELKYHFTNDTAENGAFYNLLQATTDLEITHLDSLIDSLYFAPNAKDIFKSYILESCAGSGKFDMIFKFLKTSPPVELNNSYLIMNTFRDSILLAYKFIDELIDLFKFHDYRAPILNMSSTILIEGDLKYKMKIDSLYDYYVSYFDEDLKNYKDSLNNNENYYYDQNIIEYLFYFEEIIKDKNKIFLTSLYELENPEFIENVLIPCMIMNNMTVEKSSLDSMFYYDYKVFNVLLAYEKINKIKTIPKYYSNQQNQMKYKLAYYLYNEDVYYEDLEFLEKISVGDEKIYTYKIKNEQENEANGYYIGLVKLKSNIKKYKLSELIAYYIWIENDKVNWKKEIEKYLDEINMYAY